MGEAWDAAENKPASPLDRGLYDCARDRRICLLGAVCPCVLIGRTAEFVGDECVRLCLYEWSTCPVTPTAPPGRHLARNAATSLRLDSLTVAAAAATGPVARLGVALRCHAVSGPSSDGACTWQWVTTRRPSRSRACGTTACALRAASARRRDWLPQRPEISSSKERCREWSDSWLIWTSLVYMLWSTSLRWIGSDFECQFADAETLRDVRSGCVWVPCGCQLV
jgi:Cys-rich protein (TIGR01571 family)